MEAHLVLQIFEWRAGSVVSNVAWTQEGPGFISNGAFLCGVFLFTICLYGFLLNTVASSHIQRTLIWLLVILKWLKCTQLIVLWVARTLKMPARHRLKNCCFAFLEIHSLTFFLTCLYAAYKAGLVCSWTSLTVKTVTWHFFPLFSGGNRIFFILILVRMWKWENITLLTNQYLWLTFGLWGLVAAH